MNTEKHKEQLGKDIAFGIQQTAACWATDFIDPPLSAYIQKKLESSGHESEHKYAWAGEIIGDSLAIFAFLGARKFLAAPMEAATRFTKRLLNPLLESSGKKTLKEWTQRHNIAPGSAEYARKLEEWKDFQADNMVKTSVIGVSSIALNVATQKALGNTHKTSVILLSKLAGAAITMATMMGLRFALPKTTKTIDEEMSERYFAPVIRSAQKMAGAKVDEEYKSQETDIKSEYSSRYPQRVQSGYARAEHQRSKQRTQPQHGY